MRHCVGDRLVSPPDELSRRVSYPPPQELNPNTPEALARIVYCSLTVPDYGLAESIVDPAKIAKVRQLVPIAHFARKMLRQYRPHRADRERFDHVRFRFSLHIFQ